MEIVEFLDINKDEIRISENGSPWRVARQVTSMDFVDVCWNGKVFVTVVG